MLYKAPIMMIDEILVLVGRNIRLDLVNFRNPLTIIVHPELFNPPFINALNTVNNDVNDSTIWLIVKLLGCVLDTVYSILRMMIASMLGGMIMVSYLVLSIFLYVTLRRRWRIVFEFLKNDILIV